MKITVKIILIGDSYVGKSSIQKSYVFNNTHHGPDFFNIKSSNPTIGAEFLKTELIVNDKPLTIQIWDTYGCERFKTTGSIFYRGTNCCILSFDVTNEDSFKNLKYWKKEFEENILTDYSNNKDIQSPFVVFANKIDLTTQRIISSERAESWCKENGNIPYFEVSAKDSININEAFAATAKIALDQYLIKHTEDCQSIKPFAIQNQINPKYTTCC